ncbi:predicted protein [Uncinocarpus reesii 1704]|uniref:Large ribosomal subunit protein mL54 n=1 Tax=Uncinocarpus reesii (strain UAMH 1704) TaxID=336963 RepID=C4JHZ0_UNCRE|nr:uncharacterized protein UREG_01415 [Uncinocarpus reesii 1704]EEP76566.1 predicted protein [Uncinocarpus reesii 1704]
MLCSRCRTHLLSRLPFSRGASSLPPSRNARLNSTTQQRTYSTPTNPTQAPAAENSASGDANEATVTTTAASPKASSSVPAGTRLIGLNYFKNKPEILAKEDSEYPDWLWKLLDDPTAKAKSGAGSVDVSTLNKKQRKRHEKKMAALAASKPRVIPLHEQTVDIIPADAVTADAEKNYDVAATGIEAREAINKSARLARRKAIKEANFLKGL